MHICSVSFGKDSLAMLLRLMNESMPIDEVVFFDTGMEFKAIYDIRDEMKRRLQERSIRFIELKPKYPFLWQMLQKPINGKNGFHLGYSWCGGPCRWGTSQKVQAIDRYAKQRGATVYVGLAFDERGRLPKCLSPWKRYPLIEWKMSEADCLDYCYQYGYAWDEHGIKLYDILDRVSCWCCANKNLKELRNIYNYLPEYWEKLKRIQMKTVRPMKGDGKSVFDLEKRFFEVNRTM